jgi:RNA polymerase sigma-70 factor (ECF subfamily)
MKNELSAELVARWRSGDRQAADDLFERYTPRLIALARQRLSTRLARRLDPEDVVQSAYRSFCAADADRFMLQSRGDLWRLLASITLHKLQHQVHRHKALKRSVENERGFGGESSLESFKGNTATREPAPDQAVIMAEELEGLLRGLKPLDSRIVSLRLEGYRIEEIASETDRSERWVRRVLELVKVRLSRRSEKLSGT